MDKVDGTDVDKSEWIKLEFLMDIDNPVTKYSRQFSIFKDGCLEDWIKWVMAFREIDNLMPICMQKYYMRQQRGLYMGLNTSVQQLVERLNDLNRYLLYFPE
jgi:hypothetical protein